jgi:hypothetical protein
MTFKINGVADIISVQTITWAANKIANSARGFARTKGIAKVAQVSVGTASVTKNTLSINIKTSEAGMAFEHGSGLHDPQHPHFISIDAKNVPNLIFEGTNSFEGQIIRTPHVNHPGVAPKPFIQPAKDKHREEIKRKIAEEAGVNLRLAIRGMARKV